MEKGEGVKKKFKIIRKNSDSNGKHLASLVTPSPKAKGWSERKEGVGREKIKIPTEEFVSISPLQRFAGVTRGGQAIDALGSGKA